MHIPHTVLCPCAVVEAISLCRSHFTGSCSPTRLYQINAPPVKRGQLNSHLRTRFSTGWHWFQRKISCVLFTPSLSCNQFRESAYTDFFTIYVGPNLVKAKQYRYLSVRDIDMFFTMSVTCIMNGLDYAHLSFRLDSLAEILKVQ